MAIPFTKTEVLASITSYLDSKKRPCPAHFLTDKFGDDVEETILALKSEGVIVGRRGRNGGIVFPNTVFPAKKVDIADDTATSSPGDKLTVTQVR